MLVAPTEPPSLRGLGKTSSKPEQFGVDILFASKGSWYGIQRKEISDLINSVQDGRLSRELAMMKRLHNGMLLVEGNVRFTMDGALIGDGYGQQWTEAQYRGVLWSVQAMGYQVTHTDSLDKTLETVELYIAWVRKGKHVSLLRRPGPDSVWGKPTNRDYALHLVMGLPGVGPELASRMVDLFGVPFGWKITQSDLQTIPGIGKKKAEAIWNALEGVGEGA